MKLSDFKYAVEDLVEVYGVSLYEDVCLKSDRGVERIDGFDIVETDNYTGLFVLDSYGNPAVSSKVVQELEEKIEQLEAEVELLRKLLNKKY